jgi:cAMP-dependent protein kinase regulator
MTEALRDEIKRLRSLQGLPDQDILKRVVSEDDASADFSEYRGIFGVAAGREQPVGQDTIEIFAESPIFSSLNAEQFVGLVQALELRPFNVGDTIIREGESGDSFFMIGRGRVVVSATNFAGHKVYMTSLADGDCFGEQSFFTGEPRNATVEALQEVLVLEASKEVLNRVVVEFPTVRESLRRFYKERIAQSLLAKSPLFGHLSITARRLFAERFTFESYNPGDLIIREGDLSDAFYAIKSGRVLVYTGREKDAIPLAELSPGEIFGEMAALEGTHRTASVRALTDCEILRLESSELNTLLAKHVEIRRMIEEKIETRSEDRWRKIIEST